MLLLLSPAKSLDFSTPAPAIPHSQPDYLPQAAQLIQVLQQFAPHEIAQLMELSDKLAVLNVGRYHEWQPPFTLDNAKHAVLAFDGDVYDGMAAGRFSPEDLHFAQSHVRILSGLYGLLRPLDLIQAYRLEMGTKLKNPVGKDLYAFWGHTLAQALNDELEQHSCPVFINLASEEYFKAVGAKRLRFPLIQPVFEDWKNGRYKIISFYAKRARGLMTRYAVTQRIQAPEALKDFDLDGYQYTPSASDEHTWVFRRRQE